LQVHRMNHYYRLVRSADGTRYMPAPETAKSQGKASKAVASVSVLLGLVAAGGNAWAQAPPANALPTGAQVAAGQASIGQNGKQMTINQGSDRAVINWQGFDIGSQAAVRFNQPGTSSVALNRGGRRCQPDPRPAQRQWPALGAQPQRRGVWCRQPGGCGRPGGQHHAQQRRRLHGRQGRVPSQRQHR
jgi:hypothetical protein